MSWEDILKVDGKKLLEGYYSSGDESDYIDGLSPKQKEALREAKLKESIEREEKEVKFLKQIEPKIEKILNYYVSDESDYNNKTVDKLKNALNSAFNFDRIDVDYYSGPEHFIIDIGISEKYGPQEWEYWALDVEYKFDKDKKFESNYTTHFTK